MTRSRRETVDENVLIAKFSLHTNRIQYLSDSVLDFFGVTPEECLFTDIFQWMHPTDADRIYKNIMRHTRISAPYQDPTGTLFEVRDSVRLHFYDGPYRWFEVFTYEWYSDGLIVANMRLMPNPTLKMYIEAAQSSPYISEIYAACIHSELVRNGIGSRMYFSPYSTARTLESDYLNIPVCSADSPLNILLLAAARLNACMIRESAHTPGTSGPPEFLHSLYSPDSNMYTSNNNNITSGGKMSSNFNQSILDQKLSSSTSPHHTNFGVEPTSQIDNGNLVNIEQSLLSPISNNQKPLINNNNNNNVNNFHNSNNQYPSSTNLKVDHRSLGSPSCSSSSLLMASLSPSLTPLPSQPTFEDMQILEQLNNQSTSNHNNNETSGPSNLTISANHNYNPMEQNSIKNFSRSSLTPQSPSSRAPVVDSGLFNFNTSPNNAPPPMNSYQSINTLYSTSPIDSSHPNGGGAPLNMSSINPVSPSSPPTSLRVLSPALLPSQPAPHHFLNHSPFSSSSSPMLNNNNHSSSLTSAIIMANPGSSTSTKNLATGVGSPLVVVTQAAPDSSSSIYGSLSNQQLMNNNNINNICSSISPCNEINTLDKTSLTLENSFLTSTTDKLYSSPLNNLVTSVAAAASNSNSNTAFNVHSLLRPSPPPSPRLTNIMSNNNNNNSLGNSNGFELRTSLYPFVSHQPLSSSHSPSAGPLRRLSAASLMVNDNNHNINNNSVSMHSPTSLSANNLIVESSNTLHNSNSPNPADNSSRSFSNYMLWLLLFHFSFAHRLDTHSPILGFFTHAPGVYHECWMVVPGEPSVYHAPHSNMYSSSQFHINNSVAQGTNNSIDVGGFMSPDVNNVLLGSHTSSHLIGGKKGNKRSNRWGGTPGHQVGRQSGWLATTYLSGAPYTSSSVTPGLRHNLFGSNHGNGGMQSTSVVDEALGLHHSTVNTQNLMFMFDRGSNRMASANATVSSAAAIAAVGGQLATTTRQFGGSSRSHFGTAAGLLASSATSFNNNNLNSNYSSRVSPNSNLAIANNRVGGINNNNASRSNHRIVHGSLNMPTSTASISASSSNGFASRLTSGARVHHANMSVAGLLAEFAGMRSSTVLNSNISGLNSIPNAVNSTSISSNAMVNNTLSSENLDLSLVSAVALGLSPGMRAMRQPSANRLGVREFAGGLHSPTTRSVGPVLLSRDHFERDDSDEESDHVYDNDDDDSVDVEDNFDKKMDNILIDDNKKTSSESRKKKKKHYNGSLSAANDAHGVSSASKSASLMDLCLDNDPNDFSFQLPRRRVSQQNSSKNSVSSSITNQNNSSTATTTNAGAHPRIDMSLGCGSRTPLTGRTPIPHSTSLYAFTPAPKSVPKSNFFNSTTSLNNINRSIKTDLTVEELSSGCEDQITISSPLISNSLKNNSSRKYKNKKKKNLNENNDYFLNSKLSSKSSSSVVIHSNNSKQLSNNVHQEIFPFSNPENGNFNLPRQLSGHSIDPYAESSSHFLSNKNNTIDNILLPFGNSNLNNSDAALMLSSEFSDVDVLPSSSTHHLAFLKNDNLNNNFGLRSYQSHLNNHHANNIFKFHGLSNLGRKGLKINMNRIRYLLNESVYRSNNLNSNNNVSNVVTGGYPSNLQIGDIIPFSSGFNFNNKKNRFILKNDILGSHLISNGVSGNLHNNFHSIQNSYGINNSTTLRLNKRDLRRKSKLRSLGRKAGLHEKLNNLHHTSNNNSGINSGMPACISDPDSWDQSLFEGWSSSTRTRNSQSNQKMSRNSVNMTSNSSLVGKPPLRKRSASSRLSHLDSNMNANSRHDHNGRRSSKEGRHIGMFINKSDRVSSKVGCYPGNKKRNSIFASKNELINEDSLLINPKTSSNLEQNSLNETKSNELAQQKNESYLTTANAASPPPPPRKKKPKRWLTRPRILDTRALFEVQSSTSSSSHSSLDNQIESEASGDVLTVIVNNQVPSSAPQQTFPKKQGTSFKNNLLNINMTNINNNTYNKMTANRQLAKSQPKSSLCASPPTQPISSPVTSPLLSSACPLVSLPEPENDNSHTILPPDVPSHSVLFSHSFSKSSFALKGKPINKPSSALSRATSPKSVDGFKDQDNAISEIHFSQHEDIEPSPSFLNLNGEDNWESTSVQEILQTVDNSGREKSDHPITSSFSPTSEDNKLVELPTALVISPTPTLAHPDVLDSDPHATSNSQSLAVTLPATSDVLLSKQNNQMLSPMSENVQTSAFHGTSPLLRTGSPVILSRLFSTSPAGGVTDSLSGNSPSFLKGDGSPLNHSNINNQTKVPFHSNLNATSTSSMISGSHNNHLLLSGTDLLRAAGLTPSSSHQNSTVNPINSANTNIFNKDRAKDTTAQIPFGVGGSTSAISITPPPSSVFPLSASSTSKQNFLSRANNPITTFGVLDKDIKNNTNITTSIKAVDTMTIAHNPLKTRPPPLKLGLSGITTLLNQHNSSNNTSTLSVNVTPPSNKPPSPISESAPAVQIGVSANHPLHIPLLKTGSSPPSASSSSDKSLLPTAPNIGASAPNFQSLRPPSLTLGGGSATSSLLLRRSALLNSGSVSEGPSQQTGAVVNASQTLQATSNSDQLVNGSSASSNTLLNKPPPLVIQKRPSLDARASILRPLTLQLPSSRTSNSNNNYNSVSSDAEAILSLPTTTGDTSAAELVPLNTSQEFDGGESLNLNASNGNHDDDDLWWGVSRHQAAVQQSSVHGITKCNSCMQELSSRYELLDKRGEGSVGVVRRAVRKSDHQYFAVKLVRADDEELADIARREFMLLHSLDHPFVVKTIELVDSSHRDGLLGSVLEFVKGPPLADAVAKYGTASISPIAALKLGLPPDRRRMDERDAQRLFRQLLLVLAYLHSEDVTHRDVSIHNVLLTSTNISTAEIRLIDFNVSFVGASSGMMTPSGHPRFCAPEMCQGFTYSSTVDVWSAGVCLYYMLTGVLPFNQPDKQSLQNAIVSGNIDFSSIYLWTGISPLGKDFIRWILSPDGEKRPNPVQALAHPWIQAPMFAALNPQGFPFHQQIFNHLRGGADPFNPRGLYHHQLAAGRNPLTTIVRPLPTHTGALNAAELLKQKFNYGNIPLSATVHKSNNKNNENILKGNNINTAATSIDRLNKSLNSLGGKYNANDTKKISDDHGEGNASNKNMITHMIPNDLSKGNDITNSNSKNQKTADVGLSLNLRIPSSSHAPLSGSPFSKDEELKISHLLTPSARKGTDNKDPAAESVSSNDPSPPRGHDNNFNNDSSNSVLQDGYFNTNKNDYDQGINEKLKDFLQMNGEGVIRRTESSIDTTGGHRTYDLLNDDNSIFEPASINLNSNVGEQTGSNDILNKSSAGAMFIAPLGPLFRSVTSTPLLTQHMDASHNNNASSNISILINNAKDVGVGKGYYAVDDEQKQNMSYSETKFKNNLPCLDGGMIKEELTFDLGLFNTDPVLSQSRCLLLDSSKDHLHAKEDFISSQDFNMNSSPPPSNSDLIEKDVDQNIVSSSPNNELQIPSDSSSYIRKRRPSGQAGGLYSTVVGNSTFSSVNVENQTDPNDQTKDQLTSIRNLMNNLQNSSPGNIKGGNGILNSSNTASMNVKTPISATSVATQAFPSKLSTPTSAAANNANTIKNSFNENAIFNISNSANIITRSLTTTAAPPSHLDQLPSTLQGVFPSNSTAQSKSIRRAELQALMLPKPSAAEMFRILPEECLADAVEGAWWLEDLLVDSVKKSSRQKLKLELDDKKTKPDCIHFKYRDSSDFNTEGNDENLGAAISQCSKCMMLKNEPLRLPGDGLAGLLPVTQIPSHTITLKARGRLRGDPDVKATARLINMNLTRHIRGRKEIDVGDGGELNRQTTLLPYMELGVAKYIAQQNLNQKNAIGTATAVGNNVRISVHSQHKKILREKQILESARKRELHQQQQQQQLLLLQKLQLSSPNKFNTSDSNNNTVLKKLENTSQIAPNSLEPTKSFVANNTAKGYSSDLKFTTVLDRSAYISSHSPVMTAPDVTFSSAPLQATTLGYLPSAPVDIFLRDQLLSDIGALNNNGNVQSNGILPFGNVSVNHVVSPSQHPYDYSRNILSNNNDGIGVNSEHGGGDEKNAAEGTNVSHPPQSFLDITTNETVSRPRLNSRLFATCVVGGSIEDDDDEEDPFEASLLAPSRPSLSVINTKFSPLLEKEGESKEKNQNNCQNPEELSETDGEGLSGYESSAAIPDIASSRRNFKSPHVAGQRRSFSGRKKSSTTSESIIETACMASEIENEGGGGRKKSKMTAFKRMLSPLRNLFKKDKNNINNEINGDNTSELSAGSMSNQADILVSSNKSAAANVEGSEDNENRSLQATLASPGPLESPAAICSEIEMNQSGKVAVATPYNSDAHLTSMINFDKSLLVSTFPGRNGGILRSTTLPLPQNPISSKVNFHNLDNYLYDPSYISESVNTSESKPQAESFVPPSRVNVPADTDVSTYTLNHVGGVGGLVKTSRICHPDLKKKGSLESEEVESCDDPLSQGVAPSLLLKSFTINSDLQLPNSFEFESTRGVDNDCLIMDDENLKLKSSKTLNPNFAPTTGELDILNDIDDGILSGSKINAQIRCEDGELNNTFLKTNTTGALRALKQHADNGLNGLTLSSTSSDNDDDDIACDSRLNRTFHVIDSKRNRPDQFEGVVADSQQKEDTNLPSSVNVVGDNTVDDDDDDHNDSISSRSNVVNMNNAATKSNIATGASGIFASLPVKSSASKDSIFSPFNDDPSAVHATGGRVSNSSVDSLSAPLTLPSVIPFVLAERFFFTTSPYPSSSITENEVAQGILVRLFPVIPAGSFEFLVGGSIWCRVSLGGSLDLHGISGQSLADSIYPGILLAAKHDASGSRLTYIDLAIAPHMHSRLLLSLASLPIGSVLLIHRPPSRPFSRAKKLVDLCTLPCTTLPSGLVVESTPHPPPSAPHARGVIPPPSSTGFQMFGSYPSFYAGSVQGRLGRDPASSERHTLAAAQSEDGQLISAVRTSSAVVESSNAANENSDSLISGSAKTLSASNLDAPQNFTLSKHRPTRSVGLNDTSILSHSAKSANNPASEVSTAAGVLVTGPSSFTAKSPTGYLQNTLAILNQNQNKNGLNNSENKISANDDSFLQPKKQEHYQGELLFTKSPFLFLQSETKFQTLCRSSFTSTLVIGYGNHNATVLVMLDHFLRSLAEGKSSLLATMTILLVAEERTQPFLLPQMLALIKNSGVRKKMSSPGLEGEDQINQNQSHRKSTPEVRFHSDSLSKEDNNQIKKQDLSTDEQGFHDSICAGSNVRIVVWRLKSKFTSATQPEPQNGKNVSSSSFSHKSSNPPPPSILAAFEQSPPAEQLVALYCPRVGPAPAIHFPAPPPSASSVPLPNVPLPTMPHSLSAPSHHRPPFLINPTATIPKKISQKLLVPFPPSSDPLANLLTPSTPHAASAKTPSSSRSRPDMPFWRALGLAFSYALLATAPTERLETIGEKQAAYAAVSASGGSGAYGLLAAAAAANGSSYSQYNTFSEDPNMLENHDHSKAFSMNSGENGEGARGCFQLDPSVCRVVVCGPLKVRQGLRECLEIAFGSINSGALLKCLVDVDEEMDEEVSLVTGQKNLHSSWDMWLEVPKPA